jgi:hypothetical protein
MSVRLTIAFIAAGLTLSASAAQAGAASPADLCKGGELVSLRINTVKPGAKAAYEKATHDHLAWYRSHGFKENRLMTGPVITGVRGEGWTASETEFASVHIDAPGVPPEKRDAGWDAYVQEYRDSSDLAVDKFVCLREVK